MTVPRGFADPTPTPDNFSGFSKREIDADSAEKELSQLEPVPTPSSTTPMDLSTVLGAKAVAQIQNAGQIVFHTVGDTGGVKEPEYQFAVADTMATDQVSSGVSFWYHLGDVVYYFGQDQYYFEQFYDPYRNYNAPIFAVPGNHDGVLFSGEKGTSLQGFVANFCTNGPTHGKDSQGAARTTMDQPGVYFTLNAPFVKFIGLYSNTGEGGTQGVIANTQIGNAQLNFLNAQLAAAKAERANGQGRALVIATHHPPFTGDPFHVPSPDMLSQIDAACTAAGIWPDLHLSGHSHLYERYTRTVGGKQIPYVVAGMGGYYDLSGLKANPYPPYTTPMSGTDASGNPLTMEVYNYNTFGFLRVTVSAASISVQFVSVDPTTRKTGIADQFTVNLKTNVVSNAKKAQYKAGGKTGKKTSSAAGEKTPNNKSKKGAAVKHSKALSKST